MLIFKIKLKRKLSGNKIKKIKRKERLHPHLVEWEKLNIDYQSTMSPWWRDRYENRGIYNKNTPVKRHIKKEKVKEIEQRRERWRKEQMKNHELPYTSKKIINKK